MPPRRPTEIRRTGTPPQSRGEQTVEQPTDLDDLGVPVFEVPEVSAAPVARKKPKQLTKAAKVTALVAAVGGAAALAVAGGANLFDGSDTGSPPGHTDSGGTDGGAGGTDGGLRGGGDHGGDSGAPGDSGGQRQPEKTPPSPDAFNGKIRITQAGEGFAVNSVTIDGTQWTGTIVNEVPLGRGFFTFQVEYKAPGFLAPVHVDVISNGQ